MPRALNNEIRETSPQLMTLQLTTRRDGDWEGRSGQARRLGWGPSVMSELTLGQGPTDGRGRRGAWAILQVEGERRCFQGDRPGLGCLRTVEASQAEPGEVWEGGVNTQTWGRKGSQHPVPLISVAEERKTPMQFDLGRWLRGPCEVGLWWQLNAGSYRQGTGLAYEDFWLLCLT